MFRKILLAVPLIFTFTFSGSASESIWDGPWKDTVSPHLNIYKFLKNFTNQKSREHHMGSGIVDRYYQNGKYTGYTDFATESWFSWTEPQMIKERFKKLISRVSGARASRAKEIGGSGVYAMYLEHNGCVYLSFYTRSKGEGIADNDDGNGDTIGNFRTCEGFTVPVKEFIHLIQEAEDEDAAGLQAAKRQVTHSAPKRQTETQSKKTTSPKKVESSELIDRLRKLKNLYNSKLITEEEYQTKKKEILSSM